MSAATRAATAKDRARIAADMIRKGRTDSRAFDDCFEMFDGNEVMRLLRASKSPAVAAYIARCTPTPNTPEN